MIISVTAEIPNKINRFIEFVELDFRVRDSFSQSMKMTGIEIERMVRRVFEELKSHNIPQFKESEDKAYRRAVELVKEEFARETELDIEVNKMLEDLERQNPNSFERYKMFPLIKKKLAKQKGIIL